VGTARILGRVHAAPLSLGRLTFQCSFTIIENQDMDFLFGLDQLKRLQAVIDLKRNCLVIEGQETPFLAEKDIPTRERLEGAQPPAAASSSSASSSSSSSSTPAAATASPPRGQPPAPHAQPRPPATAQQPPPPPPQPQPQPQPRAVNEAAVAKIVALGFTRQQAIDALAMFGGNEDAAASFLFNSVMGGGGF
jgi:DNA damage-inducible protein 1